MQYFFFFVVLLSDVIISLPAMCLFMCYLEREVKLFNPTKMLVQQSVGLQWIDALCKQYLTKLMSFIERHLHTLCFCHHIDKPTRIQKQLAIRPPPFLTLSLLFVLSFSLFSLLFICVFLIFLSCKKEMSNTGTAATASLVDECRGVLFVYSDGSIVRLPKPSFSVPVHDDGSVVWKDVVFDPVHDLSLRLYKPALPVSTKLPIFYYIHGGGFCIGSRTWPNCQNYCFKLASELQAVIISPDYRLAPENRLPAAIEDGYMAVKWLQAQAVANEPDTWLTEVADFGKVFISGDSAGGNIAHNLAVRLKAGSLELAPVRVKGYILLAPFFGGTVRKKSEAEGPREAFLNLELIDRFWRLSIPIGETTDHPLINPFGPVSPSLEAVDLDPILVVVGGSDLLKDRGEDYAKTLKNFGKKVEYVEFEGKQHGFFTIDPNSEDANRLMQIIKHFIAENSS